MLFSLSVEEREKKWKWTDLVTTNVQVDSGGRSCGRGAAGEDDGVVGVLAALSRGRQVQKSTDWNGYGRSTGYGSYRLIS